MLCGEITLKKLQGGERPLSLSSCQIHLCRGGGRPAVHLSWHCVRIVSLLHHTVSFPLILGWVNFWMEFIFHSAFIYKDICQMTWVFWSGSLVNVKTWPMLLCLCNIVLNTFKLSLNSCPLIHPEDDNFKSIQCILPMHLQNANTKIIIITQ